jgi:hypothetical protein
MTDPKILDELERLEKECESGLGDGASWDGGFAAWKAYTDALRNSARSLIADSRRLRTLLARCGAGTVEPSPSEEGR